MGGKIDIITAAQQFYKQLYAVLYQDMEESIANL